MTRVYRLELPRWDRRDFRRRPTEAWQCFHANQRRPRNPRAVARITRETIEAVGWAATRAGLREPARHLTVELVWCPDAAVPAGGARDPDNLWPLLKICCDALARGPAKRARHAPGLDLLPDDSPTYMTKLAPRIADAGELPAGLWLLVVPGDPPDDHQP